MIKLTNIYLIGLLTAGLLVGCGGGSDNDNEVNEGTEQYEDNDDNEGTETNHSGESDDNTGTSTTTPPVSTTTLTFSSNVMPILEASCKSCHGSNGDFTITTASATWDNIQQNGGPQQVLNTGNGADHPVGDKLTDAHSATIQAWINAGAMNN